VRVKSNTLIPTNVHTHDNDTSDVECEPLIESTMAIFSYHPSSQPLQFFTMIHREVYDFSSFSGCLKIYPEFGIPLTESVASFPRQSYVSLSLSSGVMLRKFTTLHLHVAFDNITRQLANCNDNYNFYVCPYSVLQEFAIDSEVIVTSYSEMQKKVARLVYRTQ